MKNFTRISTKWPGQRLTANSGEWVDPNGGSQTDRDIKTTLLNQSELYNVHPDDVILYTKKLDDDSRLVIEPGGEVLLIST